MSKTVNKEPQVNFIELVDALTKEKGINKEVLLDTIKHALQTAYKKKVGKEDDVEIAVDEKTGAYKVYAIKQVVENEKEILYDNEIVYNDALKYNSNAQIGSTVLIDVTPKDFGRMAVLNARQVIEQKLKEAERESLYEEFAAKQDEIIIGKVQRTDKKKEIVEDENGEKSVIEKRIVYVNLEKTDCAMFERDQIKDVNYLPNMRIPVYVYRVDKTTKGPKVFVSHSHPNIVVRLLEREVPEIASGTIVVKAITREAGLRTKVAVFSRMENVDAVGTCIGPKGMRITPIMKALNGERIDIVNWDSNPANFIANALAPAKVVKIMVEPVSGRTTAIVPDAQLSVAIGKEGINVRLASKLTSMKIDIKTVSEYNALVENGSVFITVEEAQAKAAAEKAREEEQKSNIASLNENIDSLFEKWDSLILESENDDSVENSENNVIGANSDENA